jgi:hypothetical protein
MQHQTKALDFIEPFCDTLFLKRFLYLYCSRFYSDYASGVAVRSCARRTLPDVYSLGRDGKS